jgi:hypothetical protein
MNISEYDFQIRTKIKVSHPIIGYISFQDHEYAACVPGESYEVALFDKNDEWIVEPMEPFAEYHDGSPSYMYTAVYPYVPVSLVNDFLWEYNR